ncbi:hypothetical protein EQG89_05720 [Salmonella enterica subsp. enterica]|nr:hypothetical protein [Salmonella enterica subsp. enterica]
MNYTPDLPKRLGGVILEIYSGTKIEPPNTLRSISAINEGKEWVFHANGEVQNFEDIQQYKNKIIKNRFTAAMLESYLNSLKIRAFDESFYDSKNSILIHKIGPMTKNAREHDIIEVQESWL